MNLAIFFLLSILCVVNGVWAGEWAERTLKEMTSDEKIAQLFMIAGYIDPEYAAKESQSIEEIEAIVKSYPVGGVGFVGPSESAKQVATINRYQQLCKYPLLVAQDLEWGLSMRLKDGMRFPKNATLGAIQDNRLIYEMGKEIGRQAKLVGVSMNLSPDIDVNINPENPVINVRSFGSDPRLVAAKGNAMIRGLQDAHIIASAKHFPGLGDIDTDPHIDLPVNRHERARLEEIELLPFKEAIKAGVLSIQTEHVWMPALEPAEGLPASLSPNVVQKILKENMGFHGLVLSGALRMQALLNHFSQEEIAVRAFLAGHDMLLMPENFHVAFQALKQAQADGRISQSEIDTRVKKILELKEYCHLQEQQALAIPGADALQPESAKQLKKALLRAAVCCVRDPNRLLSMPFPEKSAYVQIGDAPNNAFYQALKNSCHASFFIPINRDDETLEMALESYDRVILAIFPADPRRIAEIRLMNSANQKEELKHFKVHGLPKETLQLIQRLTKQQSKTVLCYFGNPFGVGFFDSFSTFIMGYEDDPDAQEAVSSILYSFDGRLPAKSGANLSLSFKG